MSQRFFTVRGAVRRSPKSHPRGSDFCAASQQVRPWAPTPFSLNRGRGCHVWDVDGNEYTDWIMSFGPLVLGHCHPARREGPCEAASTTASASRWSTRRRMSSPASSSKRFPAPKW